MRHFTLDTTQNFFSEIEDTVEDLVGAMVQVGLW